MSVTILKRRYKLRESFKIAHGQRTYADVIECRIQRNGLVGFGECTPYPRYGETCDSVKRQVEALIPYIEEGVTRELLIDTCPAGAARNAIDSALWDLESQLNGQPIWKNASLYKPKAASNSCYIIY